MPKQCTCGQNMNIRLRTIVYQNRVEIANVPIYSCDACFKSEVFSGVKSELTLLISQLGGKPTKQQVQFHEMSELAHLMMIASDKEFNHYSVEQLLDKRINELLDLLLLAKSLNDEAWAEDLRKRLTQISRHTLSTYDFS